MVSLTFFGGINEIGGNKILVEEKDTKIFLDFGQSFCLLDDYFVDWLQPRTRFGLRDYFALDLMPKLKGLYSKECLEPTSLEYAEPEYDAVFISHPHYDHTAHLRYLDPKIPVYMGEACRKILESTQETTSSLFFSGCEDAEKRVETFTTGKRVKVDGLEVIPVHVDHSVPGAYGFVVHGEEGSVVYSGDLRMHGAKPELTRDFLETARQADADALVIEGTRVAPKETRKNHTESFVAEESGKIAGKCDGLVLAMRYPKDLDRFRTFYELAKKGGRKLAISPKTAHLLKTLRGDEKLGLPDPLKDENIVIYGRVKKRYFPWEQEFMERSEDWQWMKENCKNVVWELDFPQLQELIDVKPEKGDCIHSMSEPFEEDPSSQLQDEVLRNWLERFNFIHHQLHASGHASMTEIMEFIGEIGAKRTIPVHTQHPDMFRGDIELAERGKKIEI